MDAFTYYTTSFFVGGVIAILFLLLVRNISIESKEKLFGRGLIIAAAIYILFALVSGAMDWVSIEVFGTAVFALFYWLGKRFSLYCLALGWTLHPVWVAGLHLFGDGFGVSPPWYATACLSFDLVVAAYIAYLAMKEAEGSRASLA